MFKHNTKTKGDLGVLKVKLDLFNKGYLILNPETEHAPFDIVIFKNGVYQSVQVKYRSLSKRGTLDIAFRSTHCDTNGLVVKQVDKSYIDIYAVYCPETDECYYFDPQTNDKSISLRVEMSKNNQQNGINFANDYREVP